MPKVTLIHIVLLCICNTELCLPFPNYVYLVWTVLFRVVESWSGPHGFDRVFLCVVAPFPFPFVASLCLKLQVANLLVADCHVELYAFLIDSVSIEYSPSMPAWSYFWLHLFVHDPARLVPKLKYSF